MNEKIISKALIDIFRIQGHRKVKNQKMCITKKINIYMKKFKGDKFNEFSQRLLKHPIGRNFFNNIYTDPLLIFSNSIFEIQTVENELTWFKNVFIKNSSLLNLCIKKQKTVNINILNNNPNQAIKEIEEIEKFIGYSMWSLEYKTHIKKELLSINQLEELKTLKMKSTGTLDFFLQHLIYKSETNDINSFINNLLNNINLMRYKNDSDDSDDVIALADLFSTYFLPIEFDINRNIKDRRLYCMMNLSLIDQYNTFKQYILNKKSINNTLENFEEKIIKEISLYIEDIELKNLLSKPVHMKDIDNIYLDIVKEYTIGNCENTYKEINTLLNKTPNVTVFIELFARNNIYFKKDSNSTLFNKLSKSIQNILLLENVIDSINYIESISIKFNSSTWVKPLLYQLHNIIQTTNYKKLLSSSNMSILGIDVTPRSAENFSYNGLFELLNIDINDIPEYRAVKIIDDEASDSQLDIDEYYSRYNACTIIKIDYMKDKVNSLLKRNDLINCASFIVDNYFQNKFITFLLPIEILISKIESTTINITIDIPIIYEIYNKHIHNTKIQEQKESYEDFIDQYNEFKPSNIFKNHTSLTEKEFYFLKYVSVPSIMYVSSEFDSSVELKQERLEILNILSLLRKDKDITNEINNIFDELVFENLKASFNSSKLHVDVKSLISNNEFEYKRLFNLLSTAKLTYDSDSKDNDYIIISESDSVNTIMPNSNLADVINQIFKQLLKDFVQDANYGLDKYISMEIRHEVFFTQLRVSVEKFNLLSEIGDDDQFEINDYWLKKYSIVNNLIINPIFEKINLFSKNFDDTIRSANNWFLVIEFAHQLETNGMFDFIATYEKLDKLQKITMDINEYEVFIDTLISYMWKITYESTEKIKIKLDESLKKDLIGLMDNLIVDVNTLSTGLDMKPIIDVIELSKGSLTTEIDTISSWLNKVEKNDDNYNISSIIKECMYMFTSILDNVDIIINQASDDSPVIDLSYLESRAIMTSLHISFTNIIKYGKKNNGKHKIIIDLFTKTNSDMIIKIRNKIRHKDNVEEFKSKIKEKLSIKYEQLSKEESGGTGLHKIFNLFMNVSNKFNINIDVTSNEFIVIIGVKNENNSN